MVLESFFRKLMEKYLSDILEGVDHQVMSMQLLKGEVQLDDVKIKASFLKQLALPFPFPLAFHQAVVGHLTLAVNWSQLTSQPLYVKLERIHLWAEAKAYDALVGVDSAYVQHKLSQAIQDKLDRLNREEEIRLAIEEFGEAEGAKKPSVIIARLIALVTTSLQLEINDVHVCISMPAVSQHPGLHMGLAIEQLKFESTEKDWKTLSLHIISGPTYKSLAIKNLSVYLNPDPRADALAKDKGNKNEVAVAHEIKDMPVLPPEALPAPEIATAAEVAQSLHLTHRVNDSGEEARAPYQFLLKPVTLTVILSFNRNLIPLVEVHAIANIPALQLTVTRPQLLTLLHLMSVVTARTGQVTKWIEKQPAIKAINDFQQKRYMFLYKRTLNALWLPELSEEETQEKESLERELPYEELSLMRQAAVLELKKELGNREKISNRDDAIARRTHWWDSLFRSKQSVKESIQDSAEPASQLTEQQRLNILHKVRGEGTAVEEEVEEAESALFTLDDMVKMLEFQVQFEFTLHELGVELWNERPETALPGNAAVGAKQLEVAPAHPQGENIIALAAREARENEKKGEATTAATTHRRYAGESQAAINLRPFLRFQINQTTLMLEIEPDGDIKLDAELDNVQLIDLTQCEAKDPWTAIVHPNNERVEFGYIGRIVPSTIKTQPLSQSVVVDNLASDALGASRSLAPVSTPGGVVIKLKRSAEMLNNEERKTRDEQRRSERETHQADAQKSTSQIVTDLFFGADPDDKVKDEEENTDKSKQVVHTSKEQPRTIAPPAMFAPSVSVRSTLDVQVNNVRLSFTDSLLDLQDFVRAPSAPFSDRERESMDKGDNVKVLNSAQEASDRQEEATGGEKKRSVGAIQQMLDPHQREQHIESLEDIAIQPVRGEVQPAQFTENKNKAKTAKDRQEAEKAAVEESVRVIPGNPTSPPNPIPAVTAGKEIEGHAPIPPTVESQAEEVPLKPANSLSALKFFSPMLVRIHAPSPYISVIPDTAAQKLQRLTLSLNANARALLDGDNDAIHARADVTNIRAWMARTQPTQAISLALFAPPSSDNAYLIRPFNLGASFERFPSTTQQLLAQELLTAKTLESEFAKEVNESVSDLTGDDLLNVLDSDKGLYHMDADVDVSAIHIKLAAKVWYLLQPLMTRIKRRQGQTT